MTSHTQADLRQGERGDEARFPGACIHKHIKFRGSPATRGERGDRASAWAGRGGVSAARGRGGSSAPHRASAPLPLPSPGPSRGGVPPGIRPLPGEAALGGGGERARTGAGGGDRLRGPPAQTGHCTIRNHVNVPSMTLCHNEDWKALPAGGWGPLARHLHKLNTAQSETLSILNIEYSIHDNVSCCGLKSFALLGVVSACEAP